MKIKTRTDLNKGMPKDVRKLINILEETLTKLEYALDNHDADPDTLGSLGEAIDELTELNDELDNQVEE